MFPIFTIFCAILYFIPTLFANPTDVSSDSISIEKIIPNIIQQEIIKSRLLVELEIGKETTNNKKSNYWSKKANREKNQKLKILYYKKAIRFSPKNNWHYYDLGSYFLEIKQHQKSIKILLKMLDFNQYIIFAYYDLAENYQALKQDKKAIHFYTQYIQRRVNHSSCCNPAYVTKHYFKALVQRGIRYKAIGKNLLAQKDFQIVLDSNDSKTEHGNLGWTLILNQQFNFAKKYTLKALKKKPNNIYWTINLGHIYFLQNDFKTANHYYKKAISQNKDTLQKIIINDFKLFIKKEWNIKNSQVYLEWFKNEFNSKKFSK